MQIILVMLLLAPAGGAKKVPELKTHLKAGRTKEALALLKEIGTLKDNHAEARALAKLTRNLHVKKPPEVLDACFLALKGIGSRKVTRDLLRMLDHSRLKKMEAVRIGVCRAFEGSADPDPKAVKAIRKLLRDRSDKVIAAAAETTGAYRHAKEALRKEFFKTILGIYVGTWNAKNSVNPELKKEKRRAEQKWEIVEKAMEKSLQLLSNVTQEDPPSWRRYWNKNKHKRWSDLEN